MSQNIVDIIFDEAALTDIDGALTTLDVRFAGLVALDPVKRRRLHKMGDKSEAFCRLAVDVLTANPQILPANFDLAALQRDVAALDALRMRTVQVMRLYQRMLDTEMAPERGNHYAVATGWMLCWSLIRAAYAGKARKVARIEGAAAICESAILDALTELWEEVRAREHLGEGSPLVDMDIYHWRITVLVGLLSVLAFASLQRNVLSDESLAALVAWLVSHEEKAELWGEGAIAQLFPWIVFKIRVGDHDKAKALLLTVLSELIVRNLAGDETALPTPHYSFEEIKRDRIGVRKSAGLSLSDRETFRGSSYCAEALLRAATTLGYIDEVKALWPHFTKLGHRYFEFASSHDYWTVCAREGAEVTRIYPSTYEVAKLREEIASSSEDMAVAAWPKDLWLVFMWWQVVPHRFNSSAASKSLSASIEAQQSLHAKRLSVCDDVPKESG